MIKMLLEIKTKQVFTTNKLNNIHHKKEKKREQKKNIYSELTSRTESTHWNVNVTSEFCFH